ncbi:phosphatidylinositol 3-kinase regulatory subunit alpha-like [Osmerus eperlanus]|uniref:phosphatidylinositol 3-kinase regulatory subunit alpha-like n=1 Tax=Osmerus eperlanus TaxID=29151 RepID=UPI002E0EBB08
MAADSLQYRALFEYKRERGDDISLLPGDLLTVPKATGVAGDHQEGNERSPRGWLHGTNERTKETGDFPGTFVEYLGLVRGGLPPAKPWPRPVPPTPGGSQSAVGPQPPGGGNAPAGLTLYHARFSRITQIKHRIV